MLAQGQVAALVFGDAAGVSLPSGLTPSILLAFAVVLRARLPALRGAVRGGRLAGEPAGGREPDDRADDARRCAARTSIALYASLGGIDIHAAWVVVLSWVPFLSPYLMLSRLNAATVGPLEVTVAVLLLAATIVSMTWVAARIYSAGVLLYGQKPGIRRMWTAVREVR